MSEKTWPILVDTVAAAGLLSISPRHLISLDNSGRLGPMPIKLGARKLFAVEDLKNWVAAGCPARQKWQERKNAK